MIVHCSPGFISHASLVKGIFRIFFKHENQPWPPSLSQNGQLRQSNKAELVRCFQGATEVSAESPQVNVKYLMALHPKTAATFKEYVQTVFLPYVQTQMQSAQRIDIVWDTYKEDSLKTGTREKRGSGARRRVALSVKIPTNWKSFLRVDDNKTELFGLLAQEVGNIDAAGKEVYSTYGNQVVTNGSRETLQDLQPCNHEEADTRIFLQLPQISAMRDYSQILACFSHSQETEVAKTSVFSTSTLCICQGWETKVHANSFHFIIAEFALGQLNENIQTQFLENSQTKRPVSGFGSCERLKGERFDNVRERKVGETLMVSLDIYVQHQELFSVTVQVITGSVLVNMELIQFTRLSEYGIYRTCADKGVDLRLCICKQSAPKLNSVTKSYLIYAATVEPPKIPQWQHYGKVFDSVTRADDMHENCFFILLREHKCGVILEAANSCSFVSYTIELHLSLSNMQVSERIPLHKELGLVQYTS
ncbi:hypothetical protein OS493_031989 [Desmophyllum pertusum]|uniref:Uncharacterized protein n=1 Tax=Desmophyllum pertusum TaxID=174260 RepID=A0A9X0CV93_9CNID|nr:hypothetical protein OS493_031989 [Desmophyllum pertusum]